MRSAILLLILTILTTAIFASPRAVARAPVCEAPASREPSSVTEPNGVTIIEASPDLHAEGLRKQGYTVRSLTPPTDPWEDPSPTLRDQMLGRAGLMPAVREFDQLAKDQLFLRAQHYSLIKLSTKYPQIPRERLGQLQAVIAKTKAAPAGGQ